MMQRIQLIILSVITCGMFSCSKYVDIPDPKSEQVSSTVFTDDNTATAAVTGIYSSMNEYNYYFANVLVTFLGGMSADELYYYAGFSNYDQFRYNALLPSNQYVLTMWSQPYSYIYQANACLEGLQQTTGVSQAVKNQLMGEAKFVRAFCHFYLVNMYGDVPLITTTDYKANNVLPRTPAADVYKQVIADLESAVTLMGDDYPTGTCVRPNKAAAQALLARAYLYQQQWANAEKYASDVISNSRYQLLADLNSVFLANSSESIWQLQSVNPGRNTWEGYNMVPFAATSQPVYRLPDGLVNAFEAGDKRKDSWTANKVVSGTTVYYPSKYKIRTSTEVIENSVVLRLAEQYLIRAEARAQQGNLDGARADLDSIRQRAGLLPLANTLDKAALLLAVEQERRVELFTEWAHRWFDLKRTNRAGAVLQPIKPDWKPTAVLFPIPTDARKTNVNLTQNDGY